MGFACGAILIVMWRRLWRGVRVCVRVDMRRRGGSRSVRGGRWQRRGGRRVAPGGARGSGGGFRSVVEQAEQLVLDVDVHLLRLVLHDAIVGLEGVHEFSDGEVDLHIDVGILFLNDGGSGGGGREWV